MSIKQNIAKIVGEIKSVLRNIEWGAVDCLIKNIIEAKRIFVCGYGRSGLIGKCFSLRLMHIGLTVHNGDDLLKPRIAMGDLLIAISGTGETAKVIVDLNAAREVGAKSVLITTKRKSKAKELASSVIAFSAPSRMEGEPTLTSRHSTKRNSIQPAGSLFEQSCFLLLEAVVLELINAMLVTEHELAKRHSES